MRRFFLPLTEGEVPLVGDRATLPADEVKHVRNVLRLGEGDELALTDGCGHAFTGTLVASDRRSAVVEIQTVSVAESEVAPPLIHMACAVVKGRRFEYVLEKAVELGVHVVTPLACERGVVDPREGKLDRWQGLLVTALKQCGRCWLPELRPQATLSGVLTRQTAATYFGAAPGDLVGERPLDVAAAAAHAARQRLAGGARPAELTVLIGPEGGWSGAELQLLATRGVVPLSLGPHVLRTETAASASLVALQAVRGGWCERTPGG